MNTHRLGLHSAALAAVVFICCGSLAGLPQKATGKRPCAGLHCALVVIDRVSPVDPKGDLKYITASGKAGTYILSCLASQCQVPMEGEEYQYSELPVKNLADHRYAFLTGSGVKHEQYSLEVMVPQLSATEVRNLIAKCRSTDQSADQAACEKWIRRKFAIQKAACPDAADAATACKSFQELVRADDADLMHDLAHQDHVYACFLPGKDEFFEVTYSEPARSSFALPSAEQIKQGVPSNTLATAGRSKFVYYKNGVADEKMSLHDIGNWVYLPLAGNSGPQSLRENATTKPAEFKGRNIDIDGDRWTLTETYKNQEGTETRHKVTIQLATGRFEQSFGLAGTGDDASEPGRCMIALSDYF